MFEKSIEKGGEAERLEIAEHNSKHYKSTEQRVRDKIYNECVDLYTKRGKRWQTSDTFVFQGGIYVALDYLSYVLMIWLLWWGYNLIAKYSGEIHALGFLVILVFMRLTMILSAVRYNNRLLGGK